MSEHGGPWRLVASLLFLVLAPGTVVGLVPYWLTGWRVDKPFLGAPILRVAGTALVCAGLASLLDSFARFVFVGLGTPAPIAPPTRLVVSGQYRYVRNPMYVGVLLIQVGTIVWFGTLAQAVYWLFLFIGFNLFIRANEEPYLSRTFGAAYAEYCRSVPRWLPRRRRAG
jgi:protein-S-isoprenylcysteine O-methyltransferase Ste14